MTHAPLESLTFYDLKACNKISYTEDLVWLAGWWQYWWVDQLCCRSNLLIARFDLATKAMATTLNPADFWTSITLYGRFAP